jgi:hypothetical protein
MHWMRVCGRGKISVSAYWGLREYDREVSYIAVLLEIMQKKTESVVKDDKHNFQQIMFL